MSGHGRNVTAAVAGLLFSLSMMPVGSARAEPVTRVAELLALAERTRAEWEARQTPLYHQLLAGDSPAQAALNADPDVELMFVLHGRPVFHEAHNLDAARTLSTVDVWPGGSAGLALTGSTTPFGGLGIWDGGGVRTTHDELTGRVTQIDSPSGLSSHATHVAGTLIGTGLDPDAQGMSWEGVLSAHDWSYDEPEMATAAAAGMNVSNHSYGYATGWRSSGGNWYWYGDPAIDPVEDWSFGFYSSSSVLWDEIAFDAPYYLICKSAGNDRNDDGPGAGGTHYVWSGGSWVTSNDTRDPDGGADGYDCLPTKGTAKNILTVGAVDDIPGGYTVPPDVSMTSFSGWGPTDDGRIKPDLVANGNSLYSCLSSGDSAYGTKTGTSMSSPNAAGSANLLVRHYADTHAALLPTAAAIKALLIHSADEAGADPGPDYAHGWGLMNTRSAADLITEDASSGGESRIVHASLADGAEDLYSFTLAAAADFRATIVWTDPPGTPVANALDPPDAMLVNDLDLALETTSGALLASPWILDPADPAAPASTGDNTVDNVEQVFAPGLSAGDYALRVSHKSSLDGGLQDYALVSSAPLVAGGAQTGAAERVAADGVAAATPNPFARETVIRFTRKAGVEARITLYDIAGREVRTLRADAGEAGAHAIRWDGRNARGRTLPAGLYFAKIRAGHRNTTVKLTLLGRD